MSWMVTGVAAGGMAVLSAAGIGERNKAAAKAFASQNALYTSQQRENNIRALEVTEEARRSGYLSVVENKAELASAVGREGIRRGEGATAGGSTGRSMTTLTINAHKAIGSELLRQRKEVVGMWQNNESTNFQIQQAKEQARAAAKAGQVTGIQAFTQVLQGAMQGAMIGHSLGGSSAALKADTGGAAMGSSNLQGATSATYTSNSAFSQQYFTPAGGA